MSVMVSGATMRSSRDTRLRPAFNLLLSSISSGVKGLFASCTRSR